MKRYILVILLCIGFNDLFSKLTKDHIKFNKQFLRWKSKHITLPVHQDFMKDLISEYENYYELVDQGNDELNNIILNKLEIVLTNIMNNWNIHYFHIPLKSFYDSVKASHKDLKEFKNYFKAYEKYDKNPADSSLRAKVEQEQKKVEPLVKNMHKASYSYIL